MKKSFFLFTFLLTGIFVNAQVLGYVDFGVLATDENLQSSARSMAMKNAFNALGGDVSAIAVNPASAAVFNYSMLNMSVSNNNYTTKANFYGTQTDADDAVFSVSQGGGVLLFDNDNPDAAWRKFALGLNIQTQNNFNNSWNANGVGSPTWTSNPSETITYTEVASQKYTNETSGLHTVMNLSLSASYQNKVFVGAALNSHSVEFHERSSRKEKSVDAANNWVEGYESFWQDVQADGVSLSLGVIANVSDAFRVGLSYTSPSWYDVSEEHNIFGEDDDDYPGYYEVTYSDEEGAFYNSDSKRQGYDYNLKTPSKTTAGLAYIFGKKGLLSADVSVKNYNGIRFKPQMEFEDVNADVRDLLDKTIALNLGTEWRIKKWSLRGGYSFEKAAYKEAYDSDNKRGYALGIGYDFGSLVFDVAYDYHENTDYFNFYPDFSYMEGAELSKTNSKLMASLSLKF